VTTLRLDELGIDEPDGNAHEGEKLDGGEGVLAHEMAPELGMMGVSCPFRDIAIGRVGQLVRMLVRKTFDDREKGCEENVRVSRRFTRPLPTHGGRPGRLCP
jgi:hypothetical protein